MPYKHIFIICLIITSSIFPQEKKYYFYNPQNNFGSDLLFNPLSLLVNGSFDVLRNGSHTKDIFDQKYLKGWQNLFANISDPFTNIRAFGWNRFIKQEIWNFEFNKNSANFLPNFGDHTIGNGMQYVKLAEWFDYHGYSHPKLFSIIVTTSYQLMNEVIENGDHKGPNIDMIADVYIFNTLGFLLFEFDFTKKFFSETLPLYDWSLQPMFNLKNNFMENTGQQYIVRKELPFVKNISGFFYWGLNGILGLSYRHNKIHNFSIGAGQVANKIRENYQGGLRFLSPDLDGALAFFYDKNNSLMFSAIVTGPRIPNIRINIYPGLIPWESFSPGIFIGYGKWDNFVIGLSLIHSIPFSISYGNTDR